MLEKQSYTPSKQVSIIFYMKKGVSEKAVDNDSKRIKKKHTFFMIMKKFILYVFKSNTKLLTDWGIFSNSIYSK